MILRCLNGHEFELDESIIDADIVGAILVCPSPTDVGSDRCGARILWARRSMAVRHDTELPKL